MSIPSQHRANGIMNYTPGDTAALTVCQFNTMRVDIERPQAASRTGGLVRVTTMCNVLSGLFISVQADHKSPLLLLPSLGIARPRIPRPPSCCRTGTV